MCDCYNINKPTVKNTKKFWYYEGNRVQDTAESTADSRVDWCFSQTLWECVVIAVMSVKSHSFGQTACGMLFLPPNSCETLKNMKKPFQSRIRLGQILP